MTTFPYSQHTIKNKLKMFYLILTQNSNSFPENHLDFYVHVHICFYLKIVCMVTTRKPVISLMKRVTLSKFREL